MTKKDYKIGLFGGVVTIIFTGIYDYTKEKPILSSFKSLFQWLWNQIFEFELKIWQIIIILIITVIINKLLRNKKIEQKLNFTEYKRDIILGTQWSWSWEDDIFENKWKVRNITPICANCGTKMGFEPSYGSQLSAKCPRCGNYQTGLKDKETVERLIIDNIEQNFHLDKMK